MTFGKAQEQVAHEIDRLIEYRGHSVTEVFFISFPSFRMKAQVFLGTAAVAALMLAACNTTAEVTPSDDAAMEASEASSSVEAMESSSAAAMDSGTTISASADVEVSE